MRYDIGIDLGGTNIVVGVVGEGGGLLAKLSRPTGVGREPAEIVGDMAELAAAAAEESGIGMEDVGSVGVGVPGTANSDTGVVDYATNLYWHDVPLAAMLGGRLGKPVHIGNDANAAAYGEYIAGAAKGHSSAVCVTLGTGIGGGAVIGGKVLAGFNYAAMEIGHMVIRHGGRLCACGRHGCWERYASATGLIITTREAMENDKNTKLWEYAKGDLNNVDGRTAFDAMRAGDEVAKSVVDAYIYDLTCGTVNIINIFQPEVLCLGGGVAGEGEGLFAPLRERVAQKVYSRNSARNTAIVGAALGNDAGLIGAANLYNLQAAV
ncbi:MAG: ROK family protein [Clostridiales Family XIII bacterium]|jgi:glucokinase|nr:ROK family protein [Clostridiales Family XIII bacterium]